MCCMTGGGISVNVSDIIARSCLVWGLLWLFRYCHRSLFCGSLGVCIIADDGGGLFFLFGGGGFDGLKLVSALPACVCWGVLV